MALGKYQIISQEWLSTQPPLDGFFEKGESLNPTPDKVYYTKRQCWLDDGIYRYNQLGSDWTLTQLGANTPEFDTIMGLYDSSQGTNNIEKMKDMGVIATGWRDADVGRVEYAGFAYLRSGSEGRGGSMLTAELRPGRSGVGKG
jgi:hypothetical protein